MLVLGHLQLKLFFPQISRFTLVVCVDDDQTMCPIPPASKTPLYPEPTHGVLVMHLETLMCYTLHAYYSGL